MWEFGIVTDEVDDDLRCALGYAKEWGMKRVEFRTLWGKGVWNLTAYEQNEALAMIRGEGFEVVGIGSQFLKIPPEFIKIEYDTQVENLKRSMEVAHVFGAKIVRVLSPLLAPGRAGEIKDEPVTDTIASHYLLPVRLAEKEGITLAIENQSNTAITTSAHALQLTEMINSDALGVLWDPANAHAAGEIDAYPAGYERVRPRMAHVHIKDTKLTADGSYEWSIVGEGDFDVAGQLDQLTKDGYATTVTLEPHLRSVEKTAASAAALHKIMSKDRA
ncbi:MAG: sugar phosphate isomerase/epimerase [Nitrospinaceae bacterium]|jgi:sugar phosphate isomerase/epimerase|nr:sugar phosphate isomerase/epimerase [Nitrospinaceae bacterium]MBT3432840.1 sugar phosphate isomerase/epimerase [Nitrospinaceae bacterium]MBT3823241.1 sugar phosphate isomerase/epimerase [Nitrospinaceae bacterium]MBT4095878.1 sugar phosphate isomerase/epimerase [Nitrospinaceae bacterium]MBT4432630.1 sugar phosphate isomerase/epimerase [Nitrospinaceae bacterium]